MLDRSKIRKVLVSEEEEEQEEEEEEEEEEENRDTIGEKPLRALDSLVF